MIMNKLASIAAFLVVSCGKNSNQSVEKADPFGKSSTKSEHYDSINLNNQSVSPIFSVKLHEGRIGLPRQSLAERVGIINKMIKQKNIKNVKITIDGDINDTSVICEEAALTNPTLGQLLKFSIGISNIYVSESGGVVKIMRLHD